MTSLFVTSGGSVARFSAIIITYKAQPKAIDNLALSLLLALERVDGNFRRDGLIHRQEGSTTSLQKLKRALETRAWKDVTRWRLDQGSAAVLTDFIERHGIEALDELADKIANITIHE